MPNLELQKVKANAFRAMHHTDHALRLPNAWDVASARIFEETYFNAIATTSGGIAFSLGYPDGQKIMREEMFARIARITRAVKVPVTADVEAGYGDRPEDAAQTAHAILNSGAVGINLEDATGNPEHPLVDLSLQLEKLRAMKEVASKFGVLMVINARTDVYLAQVGEPSQRYDETVRRLLAFRDAGADCVFVPGLRDVEIISRLVRDVQCPLNILGGPGAPSIPELEKIGVARVSLGSWPMRATLGLVRRIAEEMRVSGSYLTMEGSFPYADVNQMLS